MNIQIKKKNSQRRGHWNHILSILDVLVLGSKTCHRIIYFSSSLYDVCHTRLILYV